MLVGLPQIESVGALKGKRLYLPQQDSVYSYMGRGMLNEAGLSFKDLKSVRHEKYPQAGLSALHPGYHRRDRGAGGRWAQWSATFPGAAKVLATSRPVPGGFSAVVRKELPARCAASFRSGSAPHPAAQAWLHRPCGPNAGVSKSG